MHLPSKGRGGALKAVWGASEAEVLAYMDVDLSTDLRALLPLVAPLISGHSDVAIGTRPARGSRVTRGPKREFVSAATTCCFAERSEPAFRTRNVASRQFALMPQLSYCQ